jgi:hypothetical protein
MLSRRPVLTAAASGKAALEGYQGHGIFTWALLDALKNADTNGNHTIELSELAAHLQAEVPRRSAELRGESAEPNADRAAVNLSEPSDTARYAPSGNPPASAHAERTSSWPGSCRECPLWVISGHETIWPMRSEPKAADSARAAGMQISWGRHELGMLTGLAGILKRSHTEWLFLDRSISLHLGGLIFPRWRLFYECLAPRAVARLLARLCLCDKCERQDGASGGDQHRSAYFETEHLVFLPNRSPGRSGIAA